MYGTQRRRADARKAFEHALAIDPNDITANVWLATDQQSAGYSKLSGNTIDKVLAIDPMLPIALLWRGFIHVQLGEFDEAERLFRRAQESGLAPCDIGVFDLRAANRAGAVMGPVRRARWLPA